MSKVIPYVDLPDTWTERYDESDPNSWSPEKYIYQTRTHKDEFSDAKKIDPNLWKVLPRVFFHNSTSTFLKVEFGELIMYMYDGCMIGFDYKGERYCMTNSSKNVGTGMWLNKVQPDKKKRIPASQMFRKFLQIVTQELMFDLGKIVEASL